MPLKEKSAQSANAAPGEYVRPNGGVRYFTTADPNVHLVRVAHNREDEFVTFCMDENGTPIDFRLLDENTKQIIKATSRR